MNLVAGLEMSPTPTMPSGRASDALLDRLIRAEARCYEPLRCVGSRSLSRSASWTSWVSQMLVEEEVGRLVSASHGRTHVGGRRQPAAHGMRGRIPHRTIRDHVIESTFGKSLTAARELANACQCSSVHGHITPSQQSWQAEFNRQNTPKKRPLFPSLRPATPPAPAPRARIREAPKLDVIPGLQESEALRERARQALLMTDTLSRGSLRGRDLGDGLRGRNEHYLLSPRREDDKSAARKEAAHMES